MEQSTDSPQLPDVATSAQTNDPVLESLPRAPRTERTIAALLMGICVVASSVMCMFLFSEVRYALTDGVPVNVGELAKLDVSDWAAGLVDKGVSRPVERYVEASGVLGDKGAIRYSRPFEGDSFRLQPVQGNELVWVEIRVPQGMEGSRFVAPTTFTGRLVPLASAGIRHSGIKGAVKRETKQTIKEGALLLVDGASPRASRWAVALFCLFGFFVLWNVVNLVRILRPVR